MGLLSRIIRKRFGDQKFLDWIFLQLERRISRYEKRRKLRRKKLNKSLGDYGRQGPCVKWVHNGLFQKYYWVRKRPWGLFKEFHESCKFEKSIAIIPKKNNAINIRDFRPISLIRSI